MMYDYIFISFLVNYMFYFGDTTNPNSYFVIENHSYTYYTCLVLVPSIKEFNIITLKNTLTKTIHSDSTTK